jgi:TetR/AcrR family transcriptional repressor of nem operon
MPCARIRRHQASNQDAREAVQGFQLRLCNGVLVANRIGNLIGQAGHFVGDKTVSRHTVGAAVQAFGNKHRPFERSMERYRSNMLNELQEMLAQADSGKAFLVQFLHGIANETRGKDARRGCLIMNTASEFAQTDPEVARVVKQATKAFGDLFEAAIVRAQEEGDISPEKDARILAKYVVASISGIKTMIKAGATTGEIEAIVAVVLQPLE